MLNIFEVLFGKWPQPSPRRWAKPPSLRQVFFMTHLAKGLAHTSLHVCIYVHFYVQAHQKFYKLFVCCAHDTALALMTRRGRLPNLHAGLFVCWTHDTTVALDHDMALTLTTRGDRPHLHAWDLLSAALTTRLTFTFFCLLRSWHGVCLTFTWASFQISSKPRC